MDKEVILKEVLEKYFTAANHASNPFLYVPSAVKMAIDLAEEKGRADAIKDVLDISEKGCGIEIRDFYDWSLSAHCGDHTNQILPKPKPDQRILCKRCEELNKKITALQSPTTETDNREPRTKNETTLPKQDHQHAGLSPGRMDSTTHKKYKISDCIQVDESAKEDFKRVMNWTEEEWLARVENGAKTFIHPQEYRDKEHVKCGGASTK